MRASDVMEYMEYKAHIQIPAAWHSVHNKMRALLVSHRPWMKQGASLNTSGRWYPRTNSFKGASDRRRDDEEEETPMTARESG